jgi:uncharacterized protein
MKTRFTWDPVKAKSNLRDHGVSFEEARDAFADPFIVVHENIHDGDEQRYQALGVVGSVVLVSVIFVDRSEPEVEIIRIISARKADEYERSAYQDQFR